MAYADVDTAFRATRASGDLVGRIEVAFLKQAVIRIAAVATSDPSKERLVLQTPFQGTIPDAWVKTVLGLLDIAGQLAAPTDAQIDTQVVAAWTHLVNARRLVS